MKITQLQCDIKKTYNFIDIVSDYIYMDISNLMMYLILNKTIL